MLDYCKVLLFMLISRCKSLGGNCHQEMEGTACYLPFCCTFCDCDGITEFWGAAESPCNTRLSTSLYSKSYKSKQKEILDSCAPWPIYLTAALQ